MLERISPNLWSSIKKNTLSKRYKTRKEIKRIKRKAKKS